MAGGEPRVGTSIWARGGREADAQRSAPASRRATRVAARRGVLWGTLERADIRLFLARVHADVLEYFKRDGVLKKLGADAVYPTVGAAVEAAQNGSTTQREPATDAH